MEKENEIGQAAAQNVKTVAAQECLMIPKHRFDCVNLCLKETKQALREKAHEVGQANIRATELEKALLTAKVETVLAIHRAKNLTAVKALIDFSDLRLDHDGTVPGLEGQVLRIKESQNYLFENQESPAYVLVPVKPGDPLNKSITNYIKKAEKIK